MCGIAGVLSAGSVPDLLPSLERMCDVQAHRGPDGRGYFVGDGEREGALGIDRLPERRAGTGARVGLGHRRLAIIDRASSGSGQEDLFRPSKR